MPDFGIYAGDVSKTIYVRLRDSTTGLAKTGLTFESTGVSCYYTLPLAVDVQIPLVTLAAPTTAWASGGFIEVDAVTSKGLYRLDLSDAAIASGAFTIISIEFDGIIEESIKIPLHILKSNLTQILGTTLTETAGLLAGGFKKFFNIATPTGTIDSIPDAVAGAVGGIAIVGSEMVVPNTQKVDVETIKTQAVTAAAGVTINPSVGAATIVPTKAEMDTAHGLLATEAKQDIIDGEVDAVKLETDKLTLGDAGAGETGSIIEEIENRPTTAMRGTDGANTVVPDAAGVAPTAIENRVEMDSNSTELAKLGTPVTDVSADIADLKTDISQIVTTGSAVNVGANASPNGFTLTTGSEVNNEDSTQALDSTRHELTDDAGTLDAFYKFNILGNGVPVGLQVTGVFNSNNDSWDISANAGTDSTPVWQQVGTINGVNGSSNTVHSFDLLLGQIVTDVVGEVQIRINGTGLSSSSFDVDQILVSKAVVNTLAAYEIGQIWINTNASNTGTEPGVDGTAGNPVSTIGAAKTLSTSTGLSDFHVINGSSITLGEDSSNESYFGDNWTLVLNGQIVTGAHFEGAIVSGTHVGAAKFVKCDTGTITTIAETHFEVCSVEGTITLPTGNVFFDDCHHGGTPILDFGAVVGNTTVHMHKYGGGIELQNFGDTGTDIMHLDGDGKLTINVNSSGGTVNLRGHWEREINNTGTTINYDDQSHGYEGGSIWVDTNNGVAGTNGSINGIVGNPCLTWADALTLAASQNINDFHILNGSAIQLTASSVNFSLFGDHWTLDLNGQACGGIYVQGATVSGAGTSSGEEMHFEGCDIGTATVEQAHFDRCGFNGTVTFNTADDYDLHNCYSKGAAVPVFTKTGGVIINMETQNWLGDISVSALQSSDIVELGGFFRTATIAGASGSTVHIHGHYEAIIQSSFSGTLSITGAIKTADVAATLLDTADMQPKLGTPAADLAADIAAISLVIPDAAGVVPTAVENRAEMDSNSTQLVAILAKALAYARLTLRSDSGPTTDDATELTAINANAGAGGGDYVAGDSQEGIKDTATSIPTTAMRGTDSVVLVGPTKAEMDTAHALLATPAQVSTQAVAALVAIHLDHLLSVDYDPASKPGAATALLNELIESNAGVSRYTTGALANAPSGSGGDATAANQVLILEDIVDMKGTNFVKDTHSLVDLVSGTTINWTITAAVA